MVDKVDKIDCHILRLIQNDASLSVDSVAERVNLSRNACWRRIKRLEEDGIIKSRVALVDPDKLGMGLSVIVMIRTNNHEPDWLTKFERAVSSLPEILGAHRMSGDLDYVLRVQVADVKDYDRFYQRLIARVPIADVSASFVMEDLKNTTVLPIRPITI